MVLLVYLFVNSIVAGMIVLTSLLPVEVAVKNNKPIGNKSVKSSLSITSPSTASLTSSPNCFFFFFGTGTAILSLLRCSDRIKEFCEVEAEAPSQISQMFHFSSLLKPEIQKVQKYNALKF